MKRTPGRVSLALVVLLFARGAAPVSAQTDAPSGQLTWGINLSLVPTWFDPAESTGLLTAFIFYYALHDALVKPMPGKPMAPSLAESWSVSPDGQTYDFVLRPGVRFHNGDPLTADDVKFSFERYRGVSAKAMKDRVRQIQVVDADHVRFQLKELRQLVYERAMFAPIYDVAILNGYGPRVAEPALGLIAGYLFSAPYEDIKLKGR